MNFEKIGKYLRLWTDQKTKKIKPNKKNMGESDPIKIGKFIE